MLVTHHREGRTSAVLFPRGPPPCTASFWAGSTRLRSSSGRRNSISDTLNPCWPCFRRPKKYDAVQKHPQSTHYYDGAKHKAVQRNETKIRQYRHWHVFLHSLTTHRMFLFEKALLFVGGLRQLVLMTYGSETVSVWRTTELTHSYSEKWMMFLDAMWNKKKRQKGTKVRGTHSWIC